MSFLCPCHLSSSAVLFGCTLQHLESYFPEKGSNPCPLWWKLEVLTIGPQEVLALQFLSFLSLTLRHPSTVPLKIACDLGIKADHKTPLLSISTYACKKCMCVCQGVMAKDEH